MRALVFSQSLGRCAAVEEDVQSFDDLNHVGWLVCSFCQSSLSCTPVSVAEAPLAVTCRQESRWVSSVRASAGASSLFISQLRQSPLLLNQHRTSPSAKKRKRPNAVDSGCRTG